MLRDFELCPECAHENRPTAKFCEDCGAPLPVQRCRSCDHVNRETAKFCEECGRSLLATPEQLHSKEEPETADLLGDDAAEDDVGETDASIQDDGAVEAISELNEVPDSRGLLQVLKSKDKVRALAIISADVSSDELNMHDGSGWTALHYAAWRGLPAVASALLRNQAFTALGSSDKVGRNALHCAAMFGTVDVCQTLLDSWRFTDAHLHIAVTKDGYTALHCAAWKGHADACWALLNHRRFTVANLQDRQGRTALHWAADG